MAVVAMMLSGGMSALYVVPSGASGTCSQPGYDDRCEHDAVVVDSGINHGVGAVYVADPHIVVAAGTEWGDRTIRATSR